MWLLLDSGNMVVCSSVSSCNKSVTCLMGSVRKRTINTLLDAMHSSSTSCCFNSLSNHSKLSYATVNSSSSSSKSCSIANFSILFQRKCISKHKGTLHLFASKSVVDSGYYMKMKFYASTGYHTMNSRVFAHGRTNSSKTKCSMGPVSWEQLRTSTGIFIALLVCFSTYGPTHAEAAPEENNTIKKILTDYSIIGIPGDGRCLFRSVAHGACVRSGKSPPDNTLQRELADDLRARVADEFVKRREETEWFIEGDFESYISKMRNPHEWGGEPELLMASHVLQMPITVYMYDQEFGGLRAIAEYGQEYGKDNPIEVLYHGFGHYDALHIPGKGGARSKL